MRTLTFKVIERRCVIRAALTLCVIKRTSRGRDCHLKEFRDFIMRGNVLDLAVGIIIGAAFTTVVNSLVTIS